MKKFLALALAAMLLLGAVALAEEAEKGLRLGQVEYAAHGTSCFAVITVAMEGDVIAAAHIDEFQVMAGENVTGVPNSADKFGANIVGSEEGKVLGSKRVNSDYYSANMANKAGSTVSIADNFAAIEAYVTGKTAAELEAAVDGVEPAAFVDVVTGATLVDSLGYVKGVIEAVYAADAKTGKYTIYNQTGEKVTALYLVDNQTGEKGANLAGEGLEAGASVMVTRTVPANKLEGYSMTVSFATESGYTGEFATLHIEEAPISLLSADAMTGATAISFSAPEM